MKITKAIHTVDVHTSDKIYVYYVSPALSRIDAVDDVISRHKENHPLHTIELVEYYSKVTYTL